MFSFRPAFFFFAIFLGGTGIPFDHEVAKLVGDAGVPVIVAGGLNPDNVELCVIFTESYGLDVSSGVEEAKGVKNPAEVQRFMEQARLAHKDLSAKLKQEEEEEERI